MEFDENKKSMVRMSKIPSVPDKAFVDAFFCHERNQPDSEAVICLFLIRECDDMDDSWVQNMPADKDLIGRIHVRKAEEAKQEHRDGNDIFLLEEDWDRIGGFMEQYINCLGGEAGGIQDESADWEAVFAEYFQLIFSLMERVQSIQKDSLSLYWDYMRVIRELLLMGAVRSRKQNRYYLSDCSPMVLMLGYDRANTPKHLFEVNRKRKEEEIIDSFLKEKFENRELFRIFVDYNVFQLDISDKGENLPYAMIPFNEWRHNTEILAVRLWEKIIDYCDSHKECEQINIACFGKIDDVEDLEKLCDYSTQKENKIRIEVDSFERKKEFGKYYFINEQKEKCAYDLMNPVDVDSMFQDYQIVILLDQNCFYRQGQRKKNTQENDEVNNCRWYLEFASDAKEFQDKLVCYQIVYNRIGMWLNSCNREVSAAFEFDRNLFMLLENAYKQNTDVYLYIKGGSQIAGTDLRGSNVCSDEYYNTSELLVYKFGQYEDINDECGEFAAENKGLENSSYSVELNFWKLLKSITNDFCNKEIETLLDKLPESAGKAEVIAWCNRIYCVLNYREIYEVDDDKRIDISWYLRVPVGLPDEFVNDVSDIVEVILNYAFYKRSIVCMASYFRKLIVHSIISGADKVEDFLLAYLLGARRVEVENLIKTKDVWHNIEEVDKKKKKTFRVHNSLYSVISNLAELRLRSLEDREEYLVYTFRKQVCPDLEQEVFKKIMRRIADSCINLNFKKSLLYLNSFLK